MGKTFIRHNRGGLTKTYRAEYKVWHSMIDRCTNEDHVGYHRYGKRGIRVCDEWMADDGFEKFLESVGPRPSSDYSLDRINNDGNYEPGNVRWATTAEQNRNRSNNHFLEFNGKRQTIYDWSVEVGINEQTLHERLKRNWSVENTLTIRPGEIKAVGKVRLQYQGKELTLKEWSRELSLPFSTVKSRYYSGMPIEKILTAGHLN